MAVGVAAPAQPALSAQLVNLGPPGVIHECVTAVLDVGSQRLAVHHRGELLDERSFPLHQ